MSTSKKETFTSTLKRFEYRFDLRTVFDDFLTMSICAASHNPQTGKSVDEDWYLDTIGKYKGDKLVSEFPHLYAHLIMEMEQRWDSKEGYDVLGEYYEQNIARKGASQFFTPWHVCMFMAQMTSEQMKEIDQDETRPLRILDPSSGSGRMLMAAQKCNGQSHEYYGIDIDPVCAKMTALNLFFSGLFHSEAMCADALTPEDFKVSYRTSFLPFGLFRIRDKEESKLWHMLRQSWDRTEAKAPKPEYDGTTAKYGDGSQLRIF